MYTYLPENPSSQDLAEVIDARGSISIKRINKPGGHNKSPQHWLEVTIRSVDKDFLTIFKEKLGGSITIHDKQSNKNIMYEWKIVSNQAKTMLDNLLPHLKRQQEQAELALEFANLSNYAGRQLLSASVLEKRDSYRQKMIELNKKKRQV